MKPTLYITMGLPASGKTFFSKQLAKDLGIFFLNGDDLRLAMIDEPAYTPAEHALVYATATFVAEQHLAQGKSIICNANFHIAKRRRAMHKIADKYDANYYILWIKTPYSVVKKRIQTRDHEIPPEKMVLQPLELLQHMSRAFQAPTPNEPTIIIDGTAAYATQRQQFDTQEKSLGKNKL